MYTVPKDTSSNLSPLSPISGQLTVPGWPLGWKHFVRGRIRRRREKDKGKEKERQTKMRKRWKTKLTNRGGKGVILIYLSGR